MNQDYYVYTYLDPRKPGLYQYGELKFDHEPFYVGKGRAYRCYHGLEDGKRRKCHKANVVTAIQRTGMTVIVLKIRTDLSESVSLDEEKQIIETIGRLKDDKGPLTNHTDGGEGMSGWNHKQEWKAKLSKRVQQLTKEGELVAEFTSMKEAAVATGTHASNIGMVCNGVSKTTGGFVWRYVNGADVLQGHLEVPFSGRAWTDVAKAKVTGVKRSQATIDKKRLIGVIPIQQFDLDGLLIAEWPSQQEAARATGLPSGNITSCCKGRIKRCGQFRWTYAPKD